MVVVGFCRAARVQWHLPIASHAEIVTPDVFTAAKTLRGMNAFTRDDGTPLNYSLVNIKDWCKNHFEVVHQLRINTDYSHHRYDVLILINGVPCVQIELKTLGVNPRRAMEQIVEYKHDPGKRQNQLSEEHIAKIIDTYQFRKEEPRYARRVSMPEIEKNDFNLNISRYISTAVGEEEIDLAATHASLVEIENAIHKATAKHNEFLQQLGKPLLPSGDASTWR
jgi:hypothetical protein